MAITEQQLKDQGAELIALRRAFWDAQRVYTLRSWDSFAKAELRRTRKAYSDALKARKALVSEAQGRLL